MNQVETRAQSSFNLNPQDDLNDLRMSSKALPLLEHVRNFIEACRSRKTPNCDVAAGRTS